MNAARRAFECLMKSQDVKSLHKGNCRGCGECCSRFLPLSGFDLKRLMSWASRQEEVKAYERAGGIDLVCPFLSDGRECSVYPARPEICRAYRCDEHKAGKIRPPMFAEGMEIMDMRQVVSALKEVAR